MLNTNENSSLESIDCLRVTEIVSILTRSTNIGSNLGQLKYALLICLIHLFKLSFIELLLPFIHATKHGKVEVLLALVSF